ncbi:hypothetical protein D0Y65_038178 [Glycine soja]|uniref:PPM-type phosphatase domain-containing protein n=1 Tax=Glycine soja TaxID=3848 RepID=A0A445H3Z0_GLYSO|nr:hypothetical protein D0Y65_038178 [Glycine soja]
MGICISVAEGVNDDNVTIFQARKVPNESQRLCSVYSQQGSKGLNQDAASVHEVWDVLSNNEVASIVWGVDSEEAVVEAATAAWNEKYPSYMADDCTVVCLILHKKSQLGA